MEWLIFLIAGGTAITVIAVGTFGLSLPLMGLIIWLRRNNHRNRTLAITQANDGQNYYTFSEPNRTGVYNAFVSELGKIKQTIHPLIANGNIKEAEKQFKSWFFKV